MPRRAPTDDPMIDQMPNQSEEDALSPDDTAADDAAAPRIREPLLSTLFKQMLTADDRATGTPLADFVQHVLTPLTNYLGTATAKGGAEFIRQYMEKIAAAQQAGRTYRDPEGFSHDQTMRAHLLNGLLPALRIADQLKTWRVPIFYDWTDETQRLFIAGYVLHDYAKLPRVKTLFADAGIRDWGTPEPGRIPILRQIFTQLCADLNLTALLEPIGGAAAYVDDLLFIAHNTQVKNETARLPSLLPDKRSRSNVHTLAALVSTLADRMAYLGRTPRELVSSPPIRAALEKLCFDDRLPGHYTARFTYHHVADNRGVLLNLLHEAVQAALTHELRVPLLFAPSGIVYLERYDAPPLPTPDALIPAIVQDIRSKAGTQLLKAGKGARRGNVNLQIDDSYNDYFDLPALIRASPMIAQKHIRSNKSAARLAPLLENGWPGSANLPPLPSDKTDARLDQIAEWAGLLEVQLRDRLSDPNLDLAAWLLPQLGIGDLVDEFRALEADPGARRAGGIKYWWFWAAAHVLDRQPLAPDAVLTLLTHVADALAAALPADLPPKARINETKWRDLADYVGRVLTLGGAKTAVVPADEIGRYSRAKQRSGAVCALCGDTYAVTQPNETAVAFQPGVYTARIKLGGSDSSRSLCSICALEQLLRQLFVLNLDTGRDVEGQRVRYLSFYPSYFFTPETLGVLRLLYSQLQDLRLGNGDLRRELAAALTNETAVREFLEGKDTPPPVVAPETWTQLQAFMLKAPDAAPSKRVLRYDTSVGGTFFMIGLRNFDKVSDTQAWALPTFMAGVLALALDLKVVASEGSIPLMTEADELTETLWLDGVHPAMRAVIDAGRTTPGAHLHVDEIVPALTRLTAAYLIHLDTEFNGRDEQWQRFPPLAHSLAESPLAVFHYLLKQEREDADHKPLNRERIQRYLSYALYFRFRGKQLTKELEQSSENDEERGDAMSIARKLVTLYRGFYRADNFKNSNSVLRPLNVVADAVLSASAIPGYRRDPELLGEIAYGELYKFMDRVGKGLADGRYPKGISAADRDAAMRKFCAVFIEELFDKTYNGDAAALRGKPINLLKNACEVIYRQFQYDEWAARGQTVDADTDPDAADADADTDADAE